MTERHPHNLAENIEHINKSGLRSECFTIKVEIHRLVTALEASQTLRIKKLAGITGKVGCSGFKGGASSTSWLSICPSLSVDNPEQQFFLEFCQSFKLRRGVVVKHCWMLDITMASFFRKTNPSFEATVRILANTVEYYLRGIVTLNTTSAISLFL